MYVRKCSVIGMLLRPRLFWETICIRLNKVYLVHGNMTEEEMGGIYTHPKWGEGKSENQ